MKLKGIILIVAVMFVGLTSFTLTNRITSNEQQEMTLSENSGDELVEEDLRIHEYFCEEDYIIVDIYKTSSGSFYANMTYPETKNRMTIYKGTGSLGNAYIKYKNCSYVFTINESTW